MPALRKATVPVAPEAFAYPTGMVWCPMKMSGIAIMRCARLQRHLGCGTRRELQILSATSPERIVFFWPWLRRGNECPERATEKQVRELQLAITPLKLVERSRKNPGAYRCSGCGDRKTFGARRCRQCWRLSVKKSHLIALPRTTERPVRKCGDECSNIPKGKVPSYGRKSMVRGLRR